MNYYWKYHDKTYEITTSGMNILVSNDYHSLVKETNNQKKCVAIFKHKKKETASEEYVSNKAISENMEKMFDVIFGDN